MFFQNPRKSEKCFSKYRKYAHVTKTIRHHEWGQVEFYGRYYPAELHDPNEVELPVGVRVQVYAERDGALLVGLDTSLSPPIVMDSSNDITVLGWIHVFPS